MVRARRPHHGRRVALRVEMTDRVGPTTSVVLATYERADALEFVLRAFHEQTGGHTFEVIVADDGSGPDVATTVERWRGPLDIRHVWQPNEGFRKARAMNL